MERNAQQSGSGFVCINDPKHWDETERPTVWIRHLLHQRPKNTERIKRNAQQSGSSILYYQTKCQAVWSFLCVNDQNTGIKRNAQQSGSGILCVNDFNTGKNERPTVWVKLPLHQRPKHKDKTECPTIWIRLRLHQRPKHWDEDGTRNSLDEASFATMTKTLG